MVLDLFEGYQGPPEWEMGLIWAGNGQKVADISKIPIWATIMILTPIPSGCKLVNILEIDMGAWLKTIFTVIPVFQSENNKKVLIYPQWLWTGKYNSDKAWRYD